MPEPILAVTHVTSGYGPVTVLRRVSVAVARGEVVAVLGSNGAGKSTLMKTVVGLLRAKEGRIQFGSEDITRRTPEDIARLGVTLVPEGRHLFPDMSVRENLMLGAYAKRSDRQTTARLLNQVHELFPLLADRAEEHAGGLSGGQQQMVAVGRALMAGPQVLILDEPSLGLAPKVTHQVFAALSHLRELGLTLVLVEQNASLALQMADRAYVLERGRVTIEGPCEELLRDGRVRATYLGNIPDSA
jgi:branched-chain amino acid transport system ATP-binding protein